MPFVENVAIKSIDLLNDPTLAPILTLCIKRIQTNQSISSMFEQGYVSVE